MSGGYFVDRFGVGNYLALKFEDIDEDVTSLLVGLQDEEPIDWLNFADECYVKKITDTSKPLVITAITSDDTTTQTFDLSELTCMVISVVSPQTYEDPDSYDGDPCDAYFADVVGNSGTMTLNNSIYSLEIAATDNNGNEVTVDWTHAPIGSNNYDIVFGVEVGTEWVDLTIVIKYTNSNVYGNGTYSLGVRFKASDE